MPQVTPTQSMRQNSPRYSPSWPAGSPAARSRILTDSFADVAGHPADSTGHLCADLHRFAFLLGENDGEELFGQPCRLPPPEGDAP